MKLAITLLLIVASHLVSAQQNRTVNVLVLDFQADSIGTSEGSSIEIDKKLGALLANEHQGIKLVNKSDYAGLDRDNLKDSEQLNQLRDIDIVVYGTYETDENGIRIQPRFFSVGKELYRRIGSSAGKQSSLSFLIQVVHKNIYDEIIEIYPAIQESVKTISFLYNYKIEGGGKNHDSELQAEAFIEDVIIGLKGSERSVILPWDEVKKQAAKKDFADVVHNIDADGFIMLSFVFSADGENILSIKPTFRSHEGNVLRFAEFSGDYLKRFDDVSFMINELQGFLNSIVLSNGQWNKKYLNEPTDSKRFKSKADRYFLKSGSYYFSNFYYYKTLGTQQTYFDPIKLHARIGFNKVYLYLLDEAIGEFNYVLDKQKDNGEAYFGLALTEYYRPVSTDSSLSATFKNLDEAEDKGLNKFLTEALRGYLYFKEAEYENAKISFSKALKYSSVEPNYLSVDETDVDQSIGLCEIELKQYDAAIEHFFRMHNENIQNSDVKYYYSLSLASKGIELYNNDKYSEAADYFSRSRQYGSIGGVSNFYRTALVNTRKFGSADILIEKEIAAGNYDKETIYLKHGIDIRRIMINSRSNGEFDQVLGEEAIRMFKKNLEFNPDDPTAFYNLGNTYILLGNKEAGLSNLKKAYELDKRNLELQLNLMRAYLINNDYSICNELSQELKKVNKKIEIPERYEALMEFMLVSAKGANGEKVKSATKKLEKKLDKSPGLVIDYWSYDSYVIWLKQSGISGETKTLLENLLESMAARR